MTTPTPPEPTTAPPAAPAADKTFTQAELDRIVADRLSRERGKYADYDDLKAKASQFDQLAEQQKTDLEKAVDAAKAEGRAEVLSAANDRLLKSRIEALAARDLADPADAVRLLDLAQFKVGDDGQTDDAAIKSAIGELVKSKPYLAAQPSGFQGSGGGGPRGDRPGSVPQLTRADLSRMTSAQIVKARKEGRLNRLQGLE